MCRRPAWAQGGQLGGCCGAGAQEPQPGRGGLSGQGGAVRGQGQQEALLDAGPVGPCRNSRGCGPRDCGEDRLMPEEESRSVRRECWPWVDPGGKPKNRKCGCSEPRLPLPVSLSVRVHADISVYLTHTPMHTHTCTRVHAYTHVRPCLQLTHVHTATTHTCAHTRAHADTHVHAHTCAHACILMQICTQVHTNTCTCTCHTSPCVCTNTMRSQHTQVCAHTCTRLHTCMYIHTNMYPCTCTHTHTHSHNTHKQCTRAHTCMGV